MGLAETLLSSISNRKGDYAKQYTAQQNPYMDNKTTKGSTVVMGNSNIDRLEQMANDQALVDMSFAVAGGAAPSIIAKPAVQTARFAEHAGGLADVLSSGNKFFKELSPTLNPTDRYNFTNMEALNASYRPLVKNVKNVSQGKGVQNVSPYYIEKDIIDRAEPSNFGHLLSLPTKGSPSVVAVRNRNNPWEDAPGEMKSAYSIGNSKRHEYNHQFWNNKRGFEDNPEVTATRSLDRELENYPEFINYLKTPTEINARAREMQYARHTLEKNPGNKEALNELHTLRKHTEPFMEDFITKYPNEKGKEILKAMDFMDNLKYKQK